VELTGPTVVVLEDDESVRRALGRLVRSFGFQVATFATAEDYLAAPVVRAPACLILDVRLPGMSGLQLQQRLAAQGRQTPIVFISGNDDEPVRRHALAAGAVDFLQKPFEDRVLLEAVVRSVAQGREPGVPQGGVCQ
jgi:FixJ family two-component response regulator